MEQPFREWKNELDRRANAAELPPECDGRQVLMRYALNPEDLTFLRALDKAFANA